MKKYLVGRTISMTTFREGDRADTGYRKLLKQLGFTERELLIEYSYRLTHFYLLFISSSHFDYIPSFVFFL